MPVITIGLNNEVLGVNTYDVFVSNCVNPPVWTQVADDITFSQFPWTFLDSAYGITGTCYTYYVSGDTGCSCEGTGYTVSPSVTPTMTVTPSITPSITPTISVTPSITPTISVTPSVTPTISVTPSVTPTISVTPSITPSITPTISLTPSITPTISVTPSVTPTISVTPSVTPSITSSVTPTPTPSTSQLSCVEMSLNWTFNDADACAGTYTNTNNYYTESPLSVGNVLYLDSDCTTPVTAGRYIVLGVGNVLYVDNGGLLTTYTC